MSHIPTKRDLLFRIPEPVVQKEPEEEPQEQLVRWVIRSILKIYSNTPEFSKYPAEYIGLMLLMIVILQVGFILIQKRLRRVKVPTNSKKSI